MKSNEILFNLKGNLVHSVCIGTIAIGVFLDFIGLILTPSIQGQYQGENWFKICFYVFTNSILTLTVVTDTLPSYKNLILTLSGVYLSFLPSDIDSAVMISRVSRSSGPPVRAAGLVITFFAVLVIMVLLGSEKDAIVHLYAGNFDVDSLNQDEEKGNAAVRTVKFKSSESFNDKKRARLSMHQSMVNICNASEDEFLPDYNPDLSSPANRRSSSIAMPTSPVKAKVIEKVSEAEMESRSRDSVGSSPYSLSMVPDEEFEDTGRSANYLVSPSELAKRM